MERHLYLKILKFLDSHNVGEKTNVSQFLWEHFDNIQVEDLTDDKFTKLVETVGGTLSELKNRKLINLFDYRLSLGNESYPQHWFHNTEINADITIEGVKYLQSEKDNEVNRDFIKSQKDFLKIQKFVSGLTLFISLVSLLFIGYTAYQSSNNGVEKELQKLVQSQKDLQIMLKEKMLNLERLPVQIDTVKSVK